MRRIRFTALTTLAVVLAGGCAFAVWSGLNHDLDQVASRFEIKVAAAPVSAPVAEVPRTATAGASQTPPVAKASLGDLDSLPTRASEPVRVAKRPTKPIQTGIVVARFTSNDTKTKAFVAANAGRVIQSSPGRLVASIPTPKDSTTDKFKASLAGRDDVVFAAADEVGRLQPATYADPTDSYLASSIQYHWWLNAVKAPTAWQVGFGSTDTPLRGAASAFKVAVIDTGVYMGHPDMSNVQVGKDEFQSYSIDTGMYTKDNDITPYASGDPNDDAWHGTAVSGAVGAAVNGIGTVGVGYDVIPVGYKIQGPVTSAGQVVTYGMSTEAAAAAIYDATDAGCKVINMSFGGIGDEDQMLLDAEAYAHSHGVIMVAAAGNDGSNEAFVPASDPYVLSVSAVATANAGATSYTLASFSNFGSTIALTAPGQGMWLPYYDSAWGNAMINTNGTSFSSPIVAGAAAFLWRAAPSLTAEQITALLESSATDLGDPGRDDRYGHGMLDMNAAYNSLIAQYPPLSKPVTLTASASDDAHSLTATWSPVAGESVLYSVLLDGTKVGTTSATSFTIPDVALGAHAVGVQPTSLLNWWNSSSAISADVSVVDTAPIDSTVTLSAPTKVTYPATSVTLTGVTNARSSNIVVQSSVNGIAWNPTAVSWISAVAPGPITRPVGINRTTSFRLALTGAPGWTDATSTAVVVPYYAALKTPSAPSSVRRKTTFTAAETISAPTRVSASGVTFKFYRLTKSGSTSTWTLKRAAKATSYTKSGNATTYRVKTSLPSAGTYRIYVAYSGGGLYAPTTSAARSLIVK